MCDSKTTASHSCGEKGPRKVNHHLKCSECPSLYSTCGHTNDIKPKFIKTNTKTNIVENCQSSSKIAAFIENGS